MKAPQNRRRVDHAIEQSYRSLIENVRDYAIFMVDKKGIVTSWDQGSKKLFGYNRKDIVGKNFSLLFAPMDVKKGVPKKDLSEAFLHGRHLDEREYKKKNGTPFWSTGVLTSTLDKSNVHQGFSKIMRNITDQKQLQQTILHLSTHDYLTGLPNRAFFEEHLMKSIQVNKEGYHLALFFLDFNNFKLVNDAAGHRVGDLILIEISSRLSKAVRLTDIVARLGGDEFVILIRKFNNENDVRRMADKVLKVFSPIIEIVGKKVQTAVSIGVAIHPEDGKKPGDLLHHADTALYHAKKKGGNQFVLYSDIKHLKIKRVARQ